MSAQTQSAVTHLVHDPEDLTLIPRPSHTDRDHTWSGVERRREQRRAVGVPEQAGPPDHHLRLVKGEELSVSVVIPAMNEAANIPWVLERVSREHEVIVVDGMSTDGTVDAVLRTRPAAKVVVQRPTGKGDALRAGFAAATGDVIVMIDADGSMDPAEIDLFLAVIRIGHDLVKGSREMCGGGSTDFTTARRLGNRALLAAANRLYRGRWSDFCYGYIAFRRSVLPQLALDASGFEIEAQILTHAARAGLRVAEVPSLEQPRLTGVSNLHPVRDGLRVARALVRPLVPATSRRVRPAVVSSAGQ